MWALYERLVGRIGARPTLVEWDTDLPSWSVLRDEAQLAGDRQQRAITGLREAS